MEVPGSIPRHFTVWKICTTFLYGILYINRVYNPELGPSSGYITRNSKGTGFIFCNGLALGHLLRAHVVRPPPHCGLPGCTNPTIQNLLWLNDPLSVLLLLFPPSALGCIRLVVQTTLIKYPLLLQPQGRIWNLSVLPFGVKPTTFCFSSPVHHGQRF